MHTAKYVEIVGLAGAGKTTASKLIVDKLESSERRHPLKSNLLLRARILLRVISLFLQSPVLFKLFFSSVTKKYKNYKSVRSISRNIKFRFLVEAAIIKMNVSKKHQTFVNDEGLMGRLVVLSIITNLKKNVSVDILEKLLPKNTLIVYVEANVEDAIRRTFSRKTFLPFLHEMSDETRVDFYTKNIEVYEMILGSLSRKSLGFSNAGSIEDLEKEADKVAAEISNFVFQQ